MKIPTFFRDAMHLSHVPRWTTHPVARQQSVGEHSFRVAVIALALHEMIVKDNGCIGYEQLSLLRWALLHDGPESKFGDWPAPSKKFFHSATLVSIFSEACPWWAKERDQSPWVLEVVHMADMIEALGWVATYGGGFKDRFDNEKIEDKLRKRIHEEATKSGIVGMKEAVSHILGEVAT